MELIEYCMRGCDDKKYECVLSLGNLNEALFQVIEISSFRDIIHICLKFKQGNDEQIKKYLAGKLKESKESLESFKMTCHN